MSHSRREFLKTAAAPATIAASPLALIAATIPSTPVEQAPQSDLITSLFSGLPGQVAFKIFAPAVGGQPGFRLSSNSSKQLFIVGAIKTYVLCEALRQVDAPDVDHVLDHTKLTLDSTVAGSISRSSSIRTPRASKTPKPSTNSSPPSTRPSR